MSDRIITPLARKTVRQGDFVGDPNLENNESKMAHSHHLGNTQTVVGLSGPLLDRIAPHLVCAYAHQI